MRRAAAMLLALLATSPAGAQPTTDPIGDVLGAARIDPDKPDAPPPPQAPPASPGPDQAFDARVRASQASAQRFQGALDGGWTLRDGVGELYVLELVDRGGVLEGAWRDSRRPGALNASGFIDQLERTPGGVILRFAAVVAHLRANTDGRLSGEIAEDGRTTAVSLSRRTR
jgi:hypothetical protein